MSAAAPKPRRKTAAIKRTERAEAKYVVNADSSVEERLQTLKAAFTEADEKIGGAIEAAEPGSSVERLLIHASHELLTEAIGPMLKERPTRAGATHTNQAMSVTLFALQGALAMAAGTALVPALQEGFELLDWVQRECEAIVLEEVLPEADLAADFVRGRDHAIEMMSEAVAIGNEREPWRDLRGGKAQDNLVDGYLSDVIEDPSLRQGFTAILSAAIQNDTCLEALATITLAEVQAGKRGADGTKSFSAGSMAPQMNPNDDAPQGGMDEAARIMGCVDDMLERMLQELNCGAAYGVQTLLRKAEKALDKAIKGRTTELQEEASGALHEALDVLQLVAQKLDNKAVWGVHTLIEMSKTKLDLTIGCFDEAQK